MTPTNHLDELKALRDETYSPFKRTPAQIAALNHVIKREELLADAEGHARALQYVAHKAHRYFESELYQNACKAGALALTERPALMAELAAAREQIAGLEQTLETVRRQRGEAEKLNEVFVQERDTARTALAEAHHSIEELSKVCGEWKTEATRLEAENTRLRAELAEAKQDCQRLDKAFKNLQAERARPSNFWKTKNPRQG